MSSDRRVPPPRFLPVAAFAGVLLGHWLVYLIAFRGTADRRAVLAHSGHGYWFAAVDLAIACAVLAVAGTIIEHVRRALRPTVRGRSGDRVRDIAVRLGALQTSLFLIQEALERLRVGVSLSTLGRDGFLFVGIAIQVAVALAITMVLKLLGRTAEAIARAIISRRHQARREGRRVVERSVPLVARTSVAPLGPRAPPLRAVC